MRIPAIPWSKKSIGKKDSRKTGLTLFGLRKASLA
jgi:hypothetical protein